MADKSSKTEKPTPKRRRDERKKGNVPKSQDVTSVATLIGAFAVFWMTVGGVAEKLGNFMILCISRSIQANGDIANLTGEFIYQGIMTILQGVGPLMAVTIALSVGVTMYQTRLLVTKYPIKPKLSRINPLGGFKRLFSLRSVIEALKGIFKISVLVILIVLSLRDMFAESSKYIYVDIHTACAHLLDLTMDMIMHIAIAFGILAGLDYLYQRWEYERNLKMSKEEIKEEHKMLEGDPKVKSKIRSIQRQMAMSRMMQKVPQADVVIKNPTHFAVALRYKPETDAAPIVLAKGQDEVAFRIIKMAEEHNIAVIENVPLARALYADAELDKEIPPALYGAVAEVLVYIFRLDEKQQIVK